MDWISVIKPLAIALGLGLLVGLQRERVGAPLAGFRTFPLATLLGAITAQLAGTYGQWLVGLGFAAVTAITIVGNLAEQKRGQYDPGLTTEIALLAMYTVGAYLVTGPLPIAIVLGGVIALLLHLKPQMHALAARFGDHDIKAIMQFVLLSLVILPVLPDARFGPYDALNPFRIWLMVVLIVGISLTGYIIYKFFGNRVGTLAGGILGGLISSTATTVSYARHSRETPAAVKLSTFVITTASAIVFLRVLLLINVTAPGFLSAALTPLMLMFGLFSLVAAGLWWNCRLIEAPETKQENPSELKTAFFFAAIYTAVLLAVAFAHAHLGDHGLYGVAILSGLTDMDAITLSISEMVQKQQVAADTGWRLILSAALSNLVFKGGAVAILGSRSLLRWVGAIFGLTFVIGVLIVLYWPK